MHGVKSKKFLIRYLPLFGCISTGLIYSAIGLIAILSFLRIKQGGADESSLFVFLEDYLLGEILVWLILIGTLCYIAWRIVEAYTDPYHYGNDWRGLARRTGIGLSSIADVLIAYSAIMVLLGISQYREDGQPVKERQMVGNMLQESWGDFLVVTIGIIILATAIIQFFYGITRGYRERLEIKKVSKATKKVIHFLAWAGYLARGIIIGIIGFFFIKAGFTDNSEFIVNTDKAFNFIGDHVGHLFFILVAIGTIFYGLFMFFLGITYNTTEG